MPVCSAYSCMKAMKRPWQSKTTNKQHLISKPLKPGDCVSVDQLTSPTPGLIAQITGCLMTQRHKCATVYVDNYSWLGFIWHQKSSGAEETITGKKAFEQCSNSQGVMMKNYHADNGIFRSHAWASDCQLKEQGLTFAGVNAHHQSGIAEQHIRVLQELTRTMLTHANKRWPKAVTAN